MNLPTIGPMLLRALISQDMFLAGTIILFYMMLAVVGTLISDILLAWLDQEFVWTKSEMSQKSENKPIIVLIMPDQLRADFLGCYGARFAQTPNIDKLAQQGLQFNQALSPSPICIQLEHLSLQDIMPSPLES